MAWDKVSLGEQAYLWKIQGKASKHLMISAHGGPANVYASVRGLTHISRFPTFKVPANTWLYFYSPHNETLIDTNQGFDKIAEGAMRPYEVYGPDVDCPNYGLWKWQGYHESAKAVIMGFMAKPFLKDGKETYDTIQQFLTNKEYSVNLAEQGNVDVDTLPNAKKRIYSYTDVISIRYRPFKVHTTLHDVIQELEPDRLNDYDVISCNFCRGISGGHDPTGNELNAGLPTVHGTAPPNWAKWW